MNCMTWTAMLLLAVVVAILAAEALGWIHLN